MNENSYIGDVPHPGYFIREELEARGWTQRDLAYILGVPDQAVNMLVSGKRGISPDMARALGEAFDVHADLFANLQSAYDMSRARDPDPGVTRRARLQSVYPVREMIKRGWLEDTDIGLLEAQMMRFFRQNDIDSIPYMDYAAKKPDYNKTTTLQLAWLYRVRQLAAEMIVPEYSEKRLRGVIANLPRHMIAPEEARHVPRLLSDCGVRYVIVETLPKANIDGVCFWLDGTSPVVGMSTRQDRIDNFWFVLRHELEHALNRDGRGDLDAEKVDVDLDGERAGTGDELPPEEQRANKAAAEFCVSVAELESLYIRKYPFISERDVIGFAGRVQRHPGIVVGQLQHKMNRYDWLARHKVKIRQFLIGNSVVDGWGMRAPVTL